MGHCHCASTIRGQFRRCTTHQSRYNARVGRLFAPCIVREMLSRITSDPLQYLSRPGVFWATRGRDFVGGVDERLHKDACTTLICSVKKWERPERGGMAR